MRRAIIASLVMHLAAIIILFVLGRIGFSRPNLPPVYQVNLVAAAEIAPQPTRPEPEPVEEVEEEKPEPEAVEKVPDPEREPEKQPPPEPREEAPREGPKREVEEGPDLPVTLEGEAFQFPWYLEALVRKIERNWRPGTGEHHTTVYFRIERTGRIAELKVEEPSGSFLFDQAAQRAIQASDPMPPLPDEYSGDYLGVYFDFDTQVQPSD